MDAGPSNKFKTLIVKLVHILCTDKYRKVAWTYVDNDYFPIDECLEICEADGVTDACAVLYKRKCDYQKAVSLYVEVLTQVSKEVIIVLSVNEDNIKPFRDEGIKDKNI